MTSQCDPQTTATRTRLTDTNRSKMAAEKGFPESLHVGYKFVQGYHDRESLEHQDEESGEDKAADTQCQSLVAEAIKGHPCTYVHKGSNVEQQVYY